VTFNSKFFAITSFTLSLFLQLNAEASCTLKYDTARRDSEARLDPILNRENYLALKEKAPGTEIVGAVALCGLGAVIAPAWGGAAICGAGIGSLIEGTSEHEPEKFLENIANDRVALHQFYDDTFDLVKQYDRIIQLIREANIPDTFPGEIGAALTTSPLWTIYDKLSFNSFVDDIKLSFPILKLQNDEAVKALVILEMREADKNNSLCQKERDPLNYPSLVNFIGKKVSRTFTTL